MKVPIVCMSCDSVLRIEDWPENDSTRGLTSAGLCEACRDYWDRHGEWPEKKCGTIATEENTHA
jgi:hypothetical protein